MAKGLQSFDAAKPNVGRERAPKAEDLVDLVKFGKKGSALQLRCIGSIAGRAVHWFEIEIKGKKVRFPHPCLDYDPETDEKAGKPCPYCELPREIQKLSKEYYVNVIDRRLEEDKPAKIKMTPEEKKTGIKDMDSSSWTPVRALRAPSSLAIRLQQLGQKNIVKSASGAKKSFPVNHAKYGFDIDVSYDGTLSPAQRYSADRNTDEKYTPVDESEYLIWSFDDIHVPEDLKTAKAEAKRLLEQVNGGPKKKNKKTTDDEEDDNLDIDDEDDADDDDRPAKSNKKAKKSHKHDADDDTDDDDELDLDGDDDDDDDGDEEEEERPARKSKKPVKKTAKVDIDDLDEDEDDAGDEDEEEEEEEEERPARKSKKPAKKSSRKPSRSDDDDDLDL